MTGFLVSEYYSRTLSQQFLNKVRMTLDSFLYRGLTVTIRAMAEIEKWARYRRI